MKKIMILTADKTGTGHKSASNALEKKLIKLGFDVKQINSFKMMGKFGEWLERIYIPVTTTFPRLYYIGYLWSKRFPDALHFTMYIREKKKLAQEIREYKPDLIITVHSMFTKSISKILEKNSLNIPFYIDVIDLVNPPNVWFDPKADFIFVPTEDVKNDYLRRGYPKDKIMVSGFPIRDDIERRTKAKKIDGKINILLVNPSVKLRKNIRFLKEVSKLDNTDITFICGRDERLYKTLIKKQDVGEVSKNIKIYSFVKNMNDFLDKAHILLAKAGPNMILEGTRSATPIVVTGHIMGQENDNYQYVTKNDFGFKCENPSKIYEILNEFIKSGKLEECLQNVLKADCNNGAEIITDYIYKHL